MGWTARHEASLAEPWSSRRSQPGHKPLDLCAGWPAKHARNFSAAQQQAEQKIFMGLRGNTWRMWHRSADLWPRGSTTVVDVGSHVGNDIATLLKNLNRTNTPALLPHGLTVHAYEPSARYKKALEERFAPWAAGVAHTAWPACPAMAAAATAAVRHLRRAAAQNRLRPSSCAGGCATERRGAARWWSTARPSAPRRARAACWAPATAACSRTCCL